MTPISIFSNTSFRRAPAIPGRPLPAAGRAAVISAEQRPRDTGPSKAQAPEVAGAAANNAAPANIGRELGLAAREEHWFGVGLLWSFTYAGPGPASGCTFYVPAGSSREEITRRWAQKRAEYRP